MTRVLHIGKSLPPAVGGMETYLGDLLVASRALGIDAAALVHESREVRGMPRPHFGGAPVYVAAAHGHLLYAPLSPGFPWALNRAIRSFRPQILHFHVPNTSAFVALSMRSARRVPWLLHWHADVDPQALDRRLRWAYHMYRPFETALLGRSRQVLVTSQAYLEASSTLARWRSRCRVMPLGIDPERLPEIGDAARHWARSRWPVQDGMRILALGRLAYYKGFHVLLRALSMRPGCGLLIAGGGSARPSLEREIARLGLGTRARVIGRCPDAEVHALLAACDLLCLPSLDRSEAFGIVLLEALRYGKPVVASDVPGSGVGWVVREAGHGILVPPGDAFALADALGRIMDNPGLYEDLRAKTGLQAVRRFSIHENALGLGNLYSEILSTPAG